MADDNSLEALWDGLLSKEPEKVKSIYQNLGIKDREYAISHLKRMANEDGWHPLQKSAAQVALRLIRDLHESEGKK
jgi:hypothetical protein